MIVQLKDAKYQVQEDLGGKNRNLYTIFFTNTNIRNYIDNCFLVVSLAANYSQCQFSDKIRVSDFMNVRPRSLMSESL